MAGAVKCQCQKKRRPYLKFIYNFKKYYIILRNKAIRFFKMSEEENYTELDISAVVEDSDQYLANDYQSTEIGESELSSVQDSEVIHSEEQVPEKKLVAQSVGKPEVIRSTRLPLARIKSIMKMDPDVSLVNAEAVFLVTKATVSSHQF